MHNKSEQNPNNSMGGQVINELNQVTACSLFPTVRRLEPELTSLKIVASIIEYYSANLIS